MFSQADTFNISHAAYVSKEEEGDFGDKLVMTMAENMLSNQWWIQFGSE